MRRIDAAADLVIRGVNRFAIVVKGERAGADPTHGSFGRAVRGEVKGIDLEHASVARSQEADVPRQNPSLRFDRRACRHQGNERIARLEHRTGREFRHGKHDRCFGSRQPNQILELRGLFVLSPGSVEIVAGGDEVLN